MHFLTREASLIKTLLTRYMDAVPMDCTLATLVALLLTLLLGSEHFNGMENEDGLVDYVLNRVYLVMTTVTTVGYGDILPQNLYEQWFVIVMEFLPQGDLRTYWETHTLSVGHKVRICGDVSRARAPNSLSTTRAGIEPAA